MYRFFEKLHERAYDFLQWVNWLWVALIVFGLVFVAALLNDGVIADCGPLPWDCDPNADVP